MWPFNKQPDIADLGKEEEQWSVFEASTAEGPLVFRINAGAKQWAKHPALGIRVGFAVPLNAQVPGGLPEPAENLQLNEVEDRILAAIMATGPAIQVLAISTGTFKEYIFYIQNGETIAQVHAQLQQDISSHELQCVAAHDPEWTVYASFAQ